MKYSNSNKIVLIFFQKFELKCLDDMSDKILDELLQTGRLARKLNVVSFWDSWSFSYTLFFFTFCNLLFKVNKWILLNLSFIIL